MEMGSLEAAKGIGGGAWGDPSVPAGGVMGCERPPSLTHIVFLPRPSASLLPFSSTEPKPGKGARFLILSCVYCETVVSTSQLRRLPPRE